MLSTQPIPGALAFLVSAVGEEVEERRRVSAEVKGTTVKETNLTCQASS